MTSSRRVRRRARERYVVVTVTPRSMPPDPGWLCRATYRAGIPSTGFGATFVTGPCGADVPGVATQI